MRILVIHPGVNYSTGDMYNGYMKILRERHEVIEYHLEQRVSQADHYLTFSWRQAQRRRIKEGAEQDIPKPTMQEAVRFASMTMLEAALSTLPDWVIVFSGMFVHPDALICLYRAGVPVAVMLTESPYDDAKQRNFIAWCDVAFTNERASLPILRRESFVNDDPKEARIAGNKNTHYLPHAYDPEIHNPKVRIDNEDEVPAHDVVFVGSGFSERQELLSEVDWDGLGIDFGLYGQWPYLGSRSRLRRYLRGGVTDNRYTAALYRRAKIGLNIYRQSVGQARHATRLRGAESLNPRALELAALGVPHVTDNRPEVTEMFGDMVETFNPYQPGDLARAIVDLLEDDERRNLMRANLPVLAGDWTFERRVNLFEQILDQTRKVR
jgi:glycosyltransferase involved in cell wall biosynthesis